MLRVLRRTNEITLAMELRAFGYGPERTYSRRIGFSPLDWAIAALLASLVLLRLYLWWAS